MDYHFPTLTIVPEPVGLVLCIDKDQTKVEPSGANRVERDSLREVQPARAGAAAHGKQTARRAARRGERGNANQCATGGLGHQLFVPRYLVALPKPEQLEQLIETDRAAWEQHHPNPSPTEDEP